MRKDAGFCWFLVFRVVYQFATMGFAFYIIYGLRAFNMDALTAGYLTAALTVSQTIANVGMGWLADRLGHRSMLIAGAVAVALSSFAAWAAPSIRLAVPGLCPQRAWPTFPTGRLGWP